MAAPQGGGGGQQDSGNAGILWIVAAIFAAIGVIWVSLKQYIIFGYFQVKLFEINVISIVMHSIGFHSADGDLDNIRWSIQSFTSPANTANASFHDMVALGESVGHYIKLPLALLVSSLAIVVFFGHTTRVFKRTYGMKDLAVEEAVNWPQINPVLHLNLIKEDIDKGPWAMALTPMQFCKRYNLIQEFKKTGETIARKDRNKIEAALKRGAATRLFAIQLGAPWQGVNRLPPYARALFAVFAARLNADSKGAADLLKHIAISSAKKLDYTGTEELLKKHLNTKLVQQRINNHAYVLTVMAAMLEGAREDGVQASADFLWLKPLDRRLWYMLNTVGRQTPFTEVAGPFAHWRAEQEMRKRILVPMVEEATNALEIALKEIVYQSDAETK